MLNWRRLRLQTNRNRYWIYVMVKLFAAEDALNSFDVPRRVLVCERFRLLRGKSSGSSSKRRKGI